MTEQGKKERTHWVVSALFKDGGDPLAGPFPSHAAAEYVRDLVEHDQDRSDLWVDSLPHDDERAARAVFRFGREPARRAEERTAAVQRRG